MRRPFFNKSIAELEAAFAERNSEMAFLRVLLDELKHRDKPRSTRLRRRVEQSLEDAQNAGSKQRGAGDQLGVGVRIRPHADNLPLLDTSSRANRPEPSLPTRTVGTSRTTDFDSLATASGRSARNGIEEAPVKFDYSPIPPVVSPDPGLPQPPYANTPETILEAWSVLEVLSPPTFRHKADLTNGDSAAIVPLNDSCLPWEAGGGGRYNYKLFYQLVLGTIRVDEAIDALMSRYADSRPERPPKRGEAIIATFMLDRCGVPIDGTAVCISSFAWGLPKAIAGHLEQLSAWQVAEQRLIQQLDRRIRRHNADDHAIPLDYTSIIQAYEWLISELRLPHYLVCPPYFAVRSYQYFKISGPPEPLLLNSFFLKDLISICTLFREGKATPNLRRYLGVERPQSQRDLLQDHTAMMEAVSPAAFPPGRWPGNGRHPLVLLQQAAVNFAVHDLKENGLLAVNGPPGTGKTTLLRDIIAAIVATRAEVMTTYDNPEDAFTHSNQRIKAGNFWLHLYSVDKKLRGHEILVASSNNNAVENISAELPAQAAVAADITGLRYFKTLSDALLTIDSWGLISAVLGNAKNRSTFQNKFWWDDDAGLLTYLAHASGTPQQIDIRAPDGRAIGARLPAIVSDENAPDNPEQALHRWQHARMSFTSALARSREAQHKIAAASHLLRQMPILTRTLADASKRQQEAEERAHRAKERYDQACDRQQRCQAEREANRLAREDHANLRPNFLARVCRTADARSWSFTKTNLDAGLSDIARAIAAADKDFEDSHSAFLAAEAAWKAANAAHAEAARKHDDALRAVNECRCQIGARMIDGDFTSRPRAEQHQVAPWFDDTTHRLRDEVFMAAMQLHKAFVDAAARPLRHNLGALMRVFSGRKLADPAKAALVPDLWASLFLVVPAVSTTFASVERMLGCLPPESLGWLLIDEAGQALPQAAVGALMRTRRAVVVGDPMQIEPVVTLPATLTEAICRTFRIDPDRFNAPAASAQTLADAATPYVAEFAGRLGSRTVGVPLLVHRRCADPMFSISNAIAYDRLMVQATPSRPSAIRDILGPSRWFDVCSSASDKWSVDEGETVLRLLQQLRPLAMAPDIYILTPFVIVKNNLRGIIATSDTLRYWSIDPHLWCRQRIGTIHTFQGREAEAVFLVLGAPSPDQKGARSWAGSRPNLLNVSVSRAKEAFYVIGNRSLWREAGFFRELDANLS